MTIQSFHWEHPLLALANQALENHRPEEGLSTANSPYLEEAYRRCAEITREHSRTFTLASALLPAEKRRAIRALYAFCRISDDLVDRAGGEPAKELERWRALSLSSGSPIQDPVALGWSDARKRYQVPRLYAEQLIDGVAKDLSQRRYQTFGELAAYCYGVACTVGLMSMHIIGYASSEAIPYAIRLGVALQLTNILRDVGEDWRSGRLYLPQDEMAAFHLTEEDIERGEVDDRWRAFMQAQIKRAADLYTQALPGIAFLDPDGRFAIQAAAELYQGILVDIEAHDFDVFHRRASVSTWGKLRRLPGIWQRARRGWRPERKTTAKRLSEA